MIAYYLLAVAAAFLTAVGQVALKRYAITNPVTLWRKVTSPFIVLSVSSFGLAVLISIYVLGSMDFTIYYALTALNYVFITLLSVFYLGERIDRHKAVGVTVIVFGLFVYNL